MVRQDNANPARLLVPKQYRHSSFLWIRWPRGEGGLLPGQQIAFHTPYPDYVAPSTGEDTPALLHRLMQTDGCRCSDDDDLGDTFFSIVKRQQEYLLLSFECDR